MRGVVFLRACALLASFASVRCGGSAQPREPPIESRGPTHPGAVAAGASGSGPNAGATAASAGGSGCDDGGADYATGAAEEPIPPCTALASCCATFETNDLQGFCEEALVSASPQECANAVESFGCATE